MPAEIYNIFKQSSYVVTVSASVFTRELSLDIDVLPAHVSRVLNLSLHCIMKFNVLFVWSDVRPEKLASD